MKTKKTLAVFMILALIPLNLSNAQDNPFSFSKIGIFHQKNVFPIPGKPGQGVLKPDNKTIYSFNNSLFYEIDEL